MLVGSSVTRTGATSAASVACACSASDHQFPGDDHVQGVGASGMDHPHPVHIRITRISGYLDHLVVHELETDGSRLGIRGEQVVEVGERRPRTTWRPAALGQLASRRPEPVRPRARPTADALPRREEDLPIGIGVGSAVEQCREPARPGSLRGEESEVNGFWVGQLLAPRRAQARFRLSRRRRRRLPRAETSRATLSAASNRRRRARTGPVVSGRRHPSSRAA